MEPNLEKWLNIRPVLTGGPTLDAVMKKIQDRRKDVISKSKAAWFFTALFIVLLANISLISQSVSTMRKNNLMNEILSLPNYYYE